MATAPSLQNLPLADRRLVESWLDEFEGSWHTGRLIEFLPRLPPAHPLRSVALVEMVKIDLERQWQAGRRIGLDDYLRRLPELGQIQQLPASLLQVETDLRQRTVGEADADAISPETPRGQGDTNPASPHEVTGIPERLGRYRILKQLGAGGMGKVYLAHDERLDRQVALKVPKRLDGADAEWRERFYREARAAATLHHPNLCPVFDVEEIDGQLCLAMAYIEGQPLSEHLHRLVGKPIAQQQAASLMRRVALALAEAHDRGVVHRDLKPANIMLNQRREPVVMDFGLARRSTSQDARLTQTGAVLGTPAYMSPEQVLGKIHEIGPATDIYSLGVMLYEMLAGCRPFDGPATAVLGQILAVEPEPLIGLRVDVDPLLAQICHKAMAKRIEDRYSSMKEMADAPGATVTKRNCVPRAKVRQV